MFRVLQNPSVPLLTVAVAAAGVFLPVPAHAEGTDRKDGQSAVAVRFVDQCDGGTKVEAPNPYKTGNLVFSINAVVVVVGPGQQHSENVPAPTGGAELVVHVRVQTPAGNTEQTVHNWVQPQLCTTDTGTEDPAGTNAVTNAEPDDQGYGPDGDASGAYGSAAGAGSAVSGVDPTDPVQISATATAQDAAAEAPALAVTGASIVPMVAAGLAMLAGGTVLLRLRRRKIQFKVD